MKYTCLSNIKNDPQENYYFYVYHENLKTIKQNPGRIGFTMGRQSWLIMNSNKNLSSQCNII